MAGWQGGDCNPSALQAQACYMGRGWQIQRTTASDIHQLKRYERENGSWLFSLTDLPCPFADYLLRACMRASRTTSRHVLMLLVAALLPLPRVGPRGGLAQLSAAAYAVRRCDMADPADAAAYRAVSKSRDTLARPGVVQDAPERTVSVRWSTSASVTVLIAVGSGQASTDAAGGRAIAGSLEMIGPLEASGALPRRCLLRDLWVAEAHRRRGLARRLVLAAEESVASQG